MKPHIELDCTPHPTDRLISCEECGESYAGFETTEQAADWVMQHIAARHP